MRYQSVFKTVVLGLRSLWLHKLRSSLTMLGVVFGVGSVVTMLAVGEGASQQALEKIRKLGATNIIIEADKTKTSSKVRKRMKIYGLTYNDALSMKETCENVKHIIPVKIANKELRIANRTEDARLVGTTPYWFELIDRELISGRKLVQYDELNESRVCVISETLARKIMHNKHILGEDVRIGGKYFKVVGVLKSPDSVDRNSFSQPTDIYIPISTFIRRFGDVSIETKDGSYVWEKVELHKIIVQADSTDTVEKTAKSVEALLNSKHKENDFNISVPLALLKQTMETKRMFNIVLGAIAGISLLVGGIGIMNIMLANVTERIREIGIRRAIGAKKVHIVGQFLIETLVLSFFGGLIGIACGVLLPWAITQITEMPTLVTSGSIMLAFGISACIGITFGLYPAYKAASLDPIKALRHD